MTSDAGDNVFTVVIAGVPRSGSTWLYNAVRLLCKAAQLKVYGDWVGNFAPQLHGDCAVHLVKLHDPSDLKFDYQCLLTSNRDLTERLASLMRMGWLSDTPEAVQTAAEKHKELQQYWAEISDFEAQFDQILSAPELVLAQLAHCLKLRLPEACYQEIAAELSALQAPQKTEEATGYDPETLLHVGHRASREDYNAALEHIRDILAHVD